MNIIVLFAFVLCSSVVVVCHEEYTVNNSSNDDVNVSSSFPSESPTQSSSHNNLSFYLLGDWGKGGTTGSYGGKKVLGKDKTYYQVAVAKSMNNYAVAVITRPSFVVALGDNFYSNGVSSSTDALWFYLWKDVYLQYESLNIPWYPVFGNHDYGGSTDAQIQRYHDHTDDDIWMFESNYYLKSFDIPGGGSVAILFIDTTTLAPSENKCCNTNGGISIEVQQQRIVQQMQFINQSLASMSGANRPSWLFVAGHYPIVSGGSNGDTVELQTYLQPVLEHYKVDAYFCGHDHMSEHLQYGGVEHYVSGAGSMTDTLSNTPTAGTLVWAGPGYSAFAVVNVSLASYAVTFIDVYGSQKYSHSVTYSGPTPLPSDTQTPLPSPSSSPTPFPTTMSTANDSTASETVVTTTDDNDNQQQTAELKPNEESRVSFMSRLWAESTGDPLLMASGGALLFSMFVFLCLAFYPHTTEKEGVLQKSTMGIGLRTSSESLPTGESTIATSPPPDCQSPQDCLRHVEEGNKQGVVSSLPATLLSAEECDEEVFTSPRAALSNLFSVLGATHNGRIRHSPGYQQLEATASTTREAHTNSGRDQQEWVEDDGSDDVETEWWRSEGSSGSAHNHHHIKQRSAPY